MGERSIFTYLGENVSSHCGYCKTDAPDKFTHGMFAHRLTAADYQSLIDRGWRRSGDYCYKPTMDRTCCPQYTIRCAVGEFRLSRSQKRAAATMYNYLATGKRPSRTAAKETSSKSSAEKPVDAQSKERVPPPPKKDKPSPEKESSRERPVLKRRERRRLRKIAALEAAGKPIEELKFRRQKPLPQKSLEERLALPENPKHKLELRLVLASDSNPEWESTFDAAHAVYREYQVRIHGDKANVPSKDQFRRFLANSPILTKKSGKEGHPGWGSFHQQYWLDGRLVGVGVLDLLPSSISSVYFFYHPDFAFLSLGTYSALQEIALTRRLCALEPAMQFYYMGFYIHSCPKMRYKGNYAGSFLLCPEVYNWHRIEPCRPKLDAAKYARFEEDPTKKDEDAGTCEELMVLHGGQAMPYQIARLCNIEMEESAEDYAGFVGRQVAGRALFHVR